MDFLVLLNLISQAINLLRNDYLCKFMATELDDGRLIVVDADRHTGYGHNDCVVSAVDNYLITTEVDFSEKAC